MKTPRLFALLLVFTAFCSVLTPRTAHAEISFSYFYDALDPYGDWIKVDHYGYCWRPDDVDSDWAPYTDGYWAYTDAGWTWVSYEDWGGITYHYGRWVKLEEEGWCWVPDYQWGPAWVSWRNNDDAVGWAPLPPEAHFRRETGISVWADSTYDIGPSHYNFCAVRDFGAPVMRSVIYPRTRNVTFIENTINITNITYNDDSNVVYCGGPQYIYIENHSQRRVPTLKIVQNNTINVYVQNGVNQNTLNKKTNRAANPLPRSVQRGNSLEVFAPVILPPANPLALKPTRIKPVAANLAINKGWNGIKDPTDRDVLKRKLRDQTHGLTPDSAPAKPVQVAELQAVPVKADVHAAPTLPRMKPDKKDLRATDTTAAVPGNGAIATRPTAQPGGIKPIPTPSTIPVADPKAPTKDKPLPIEPASPTGIAGPRENRPLPGKNTPQTVPQPPTASEPATQELRPFNHAKSHEATPPTTGVPAQFETPAVAVKKGKDSQQKAVAAEAAAREAQAQQALSRRLEQTAEIRRAQAEATQKQQANEAARGNAQAPGQDSKQRPADPRSKFGIQEERPIVTQPNQEQRAQDAQRSNQAQEKAERANQATQQQAAEARAEQQQRAQDAQRSNQAQERAERANQATQQQAAEARAQQQQRAQDAQRSNQAQEKAERANQATQQQAAEAHAQQKQHQQQQQQQQAAERNSSGKGKDKKNLTPE